VFARAGLSILTLAFCVRSLVEMDVGSHRPCFITHVRYCYSSPPVDRYPITPDEFGVRLMTKSSLEKRFGVIDDNQRRTISGLEFVQGLVNGTLPLNPMAQTLGYDIVEVSKGRVVAAAEPHAGHLNPSGTVHGGLAATLLDSCMGLAIQSMLDKGFGQVTLEFKISLVRPIHPADRPGEG